ncbi:MAG: hypothetical protein ABIS92_00220 [Polyangia bacterium]
MVIFADQVEAAMSNIWAVVSVAVPVAVELPPTIRTLLLNDVLLLVSSEAVWERRAADIVAVTALQVPDPDAGL